MITDVGVMPGTFHDVFKGFFNPKLQQLLTSKELNITNNSTLSNCSQNLECHQLIFSGKRFINLIDHLFPRPFLKLGSFISLFESKLFPNEKINMRSAQQQLYELLSDVLSDYYHYKIQLTPLTDLASWGSFRNIGAYNRPNYTLDCSGVDQKFIPFCNL